MAAAVVGAEAESAVEESVSPALELGFRAAAEEAGGEAAVAAEAVERAGVRPFTMRFTSGPMS